MLRRLGDDAYAEVLDDHHTLIRSSLSAHDGTVIDTQGDAFFAIFSSPSACTAAVIEMQLALSAHDWPPGEQVRVRMGIHSGKATDTATGPVGIDVHRAARVAAVCHGGQVVLTAATADLARDSLPPRASLRDLGLHRLKDLGNPEQIFQLEADGLARDFPPLRSLDNPELQHNLPSYLSAFVGREVELAALRSLVESVRLVTLTGVGGSGKTRLALQVAAELLDGSGEGVSFVDLALVAEPEQVPGAVAAALGLRPEAGRPALEQLLEVLSDLRVLVVLDNCEHVVDACAKLADLIERGCPKVHLLATSREPLGIDGEHVYRVRPLSLPPEEAARLEDLQGSDAVELFTERARAHDDSFALDDSVASLVSSICRRLDGIPLAIELAAARLTSMSLAHLNERLDQRFRLLTGGARNALPRQRTLRATVDWSFELLSRPEKDALAHLSVFVGGFELDAAEAVCGSGEVAVFDVADLLGSLVEKSLVVAERSSGSLRYRLLETIRQYSADQLLAAGGEAGVRRAQDVHSLFYLALSETAAPELTGPRQGSWLKRLDLEWDNVRAALAYLFGVPGRTEEVLRLGVALHRFLVDRYHFEPLGYLRAALERPDQVPDTLRARALYVAGHLVAYLLAMANPAEYRRAGELGERALEMARGLDDRELVVLAIGLLCDVATSGIVSITDAEALLEVTGLAEQAVAVARSVGDPWLIGKGLDSLALTAATTERKRAIWLEALACFRQAGDVAAVAGVLHVVAILEQRDGQREPARAHYEDAIALAEETGSRRRLTLVGEDLCGLLVLQGEFGEAATYARRGLIAYRRLGHRLAAEFPIFVLACCATAAGDHHRAAQLTGAHDVVLADTIGANANWASTWGPSERGLRDDNRALNRRVLGDVEFERDYTVGRDLSFEQVVDLALGRASST